MTSRGPTLRAAGGPLAAVVALVGISVLRFVFPDAQGIMLFAVVPITLLGIMRGVRAGLVAAVLASGAGPMPVDDLPEWLAAHAGVAPA